MRRLPLVLVALSTLAGTARAADDNQPERREMTQQEIESWLGERPATEPRDVGKVEPAPEAPPPPPRRRGVVLESSVGLLAQLGPLSKVSPTAPWFHLQLGYEPLVFFMLFAESDIAFSDTSLANPPPDPRAYALYGFGGGARFTLHPTERIGVYAQGTIGAARISEDVLRVYGYRDADALNPYFGAMLGLEWYQINPHYALALHGGIRSYASGLGRERSSDPALAAIFGLALRYAF